MKVINNKQIGSLVKSTRNSLCITQKKLALASGIGLRFISELEAGKPSCEIDKVLMILHTLGIEVILESKTLKINE